VHEKWKHGVTKTAIEEVSNSLRDEFINHFNLWLTLYIAKEAKIAAKAARACR
jgi:hypothetical protein